MLLLEWKKKITDSYPWFSWRSAWLCRTAAIQLALYYIIGENGAVFFIFLCVFFINWCCSFWAVAVTRSSTISNCSINESTQTNIQLCYLLFNLLYILCVVYVPSAPYTAQLYRARSLIYHWCIFNLIWKCFACKCKQACHI